MTPEPEPRSGRAEGRATVNSIQITIADKETPLILLAGPPACGKTMTLIRLARYLTQKGYSLRPVRTLRPASDVAYQKLCDNFSEMVNNPVAARATDLISFLLVCVMKNGKVLCQILEAPGEHYYDPNNPQSPFPTYLNQIFNDNMRKIWTILLETEWMGQRERDGYVQRVQTFKQYQGPRDKVLFLFNKIDKTGYVTGRGRVNVESARKEVENNYPGIFESFRNPSPLSFFGSRYDCEFLPFHTGTYTQDDRDGTLYYQPGPDDYPAQLWEKLYKFIRG